MREARTAESIEMDHPVLGSGDEPLLPTVEDSRERAGGVHALDWRQVLGAAAILLGFVALAIGWWGISGTTKTYQQLTYLLSGGIVGAALIAVGGVVVIAYQHHADRLALIELERRIASEFDLLYSKLGLNEMVIPDRAEERGSGRPIDR